MLVVHRVKNIFLLQIRELQCILPFLDRSIRKYIYGREEYPSKQETGSIFHKKQKGKGRVVLDRPRFKHR